MTAVATRSKTTNSGNNMSSPLRDQTNMPTTRSSATGPQHQPGHDTAALNAAPVTSPSESLSGNSVHTASSITARTFLGPKGIAGTALPSSSPISSPSRQGTAEGGRQQHSMPADGGKNVMRRIRTPHPHDVLCGRGGGINSHPGNKSFRSWVRERKEEYNLATSKAEKARLSREIVDKVRNLVPPGRFLMREDRTATAGTPAITAGSHLQGIWIEIDDTKAMAKTSQALREGAPSIRAMHKKEVEASVEEGKETVSATSDKKNKTQFKAAGRAVSEAKRQQEAVRKQHGANAMSTFVDTVPHNIALPPSAAVQALATAAEAAKQSGAAPIPAAIRKKKDGGITSTNDMSPSHPGKRLLMPLSSMPPPPLPPFVSSADISKLGSTPAATTSMHKSKKQKTNEDGDYNDELNQLRQQNVITEADSMAPTPPPPETVVTSSSPYTAMPTWDGQTPPLQPIPMSPPGSKNGRGHNEHVAFGLPPPSVADPNLLNVFASPPRPYVGSSPRKRKNMFRAHSLALSDMSSYEMEDEEFHDPFENEELSWQLGGNGRGTFDNGMKSQGTSNENGQLGTTNENKQNETNKKNKSEPEKENEGEKASEDYTKRPAVTPSSPCGKYRTNSNRGVNRIMRSLTSGSSHGDMGGIGALLNPPERQRSVSSGGMSNNVISGNDGLGSRSSFKNMSSRSVPSTVSDDSNDDCRPSSHKNDCRHENDSVGTGGETITKSRGNCFCLCGSPLEEGKVCMCSELADHLLWRDDAIPGEEWLHISGFYDSIVPAKR